RTLNEVRGRFDYVFTTGGIGPTHDDITAECVAKAFGVPLIQNPEALRQLKAHYADPADLNPMRLRMANTPEGAILIDNPMSRAPGFQIGNVYVMAGVPKIMQAMFDGLKHRLKGGAPMLSRTVRVELPEGKIAEGLASLQRRYAELEMGSYPAFRLGSGPSTAVVVRGTDAARLAAAVEELKGLIRSLGGTPQEEAQAAQ